MSLQRSSGRGTSTPADNYLLARRRTLQVVVSSLLTEAGFESAEKSAVETMTEMIQSCEYDSSLLELTASNVKGIWLRFC